jgi:hypothetical protein
MTPWILAGVQTHDRSPSPTSETMTPTPIHIHFGWTLFRAKISMAIHCSATVPTFLFWLNSISRKAFYGNPLFRNCMYIFKWVELYFAQRFLWKPAVPQLYIFKWVELYFTQQKMRQPKVYERKRGYRLSGPKFVDYFVLWTLFTVDFIYLQTDLRSKKN